MPLINPRLLKNQLPKTDIPAPHLEILQAWRDSIENRAIFKQKETALHNHFIQKILIEVIDYQGFDGESWTLAQEQKIGSGSVDVALGRFSNDSTQILAPFELKGAKTKDLDAIMPGRHKSPVQQAWEYAMDAPGAQWVLVSNYLEIRLYAIGYGRQTYERWDLSQLTDPKEYARLQWLLNAKQLLTGETRKILEHSEQLDKEITNQLYKDYKKLRQNLLDSLKHNNPTINALDLIRHTQKILDRILFTAFAEDCGLLPDKTIEQAFKHNDPYNPRPVWENFKGVFRAIDQGNPALKIPAYNGGLFAPDAALDTLIIDDRLCQAFKDLGEYDFASEISVNILGHIFEQSISDIEDLQAQARGDNSNDQKTSKRKKDGIFYTPAYITRYIVEQAVGGWLNERKQEIGFDSLPELTEQDYASIKITTRGKHKGQVNYNDKVARHIQAWEAYKTALSNIKVLDPACGSGAFLNEVFDYLYKEGQNINNQLTELNAGQAHLFRWDTHILSNNLYGVDINHESIEITKLSLWLKTANRQEKLTYLEDNIKCGNSIIDDPAIAGEKAFDWNKEFPGIMQNGGFDVVVGNPPYGAKFTQNELDYFAKSFKHQSYQLDSYLLFTEKSIDWVTENGLLGFIMPNTWLSTIFSKKIRNFVFNNFAILEINHYAYFVFRDATVETDVYILKNRIQNNNVVKINMINKDSSKSMKVPQIDWINKQGGIINIYETDKFLSINQKLREHEVLGNICEIVQGVKPFQKGKGVPHQNEEILRDKPFVKKHKEDDSFQPLLRGSLINRYQILWDYDYWISYGDWLAEPRYSAKFDCAEKIVIRQTGDSLIACLDTSQFICRDNLYVIRNDNKQYELKFILALINSKLLTWYFRKALNPEQGEALAQVKRGHLQQIPIAIPENREHLACLVTKISNLYENFNHKSNSFIKYIKTQIKADNLEKQISKWHALEFAKFIKILSKTSIKSNGSSFPKKQETEWFEVFEERKTEIVKIKAEIDKTDKEIDQMVYELYGLTEEEIKLVEENQ